MEPLVVHGDDAETIRYPDDQIRVTAPAGSDVQVALYESADRAGPPAHRHPWAEVQVVVDGWAEFLLDGGSWQAGGPGTVQFLPAGGAHSVRVPQGTARIVQVSIGAPYDGFAREMARCFAEGASLAMIEDAARRHGVELA